MEVLERRADELDSKGETNSADIRELRALLAQVIDILCHRGDINEGHTRLLGKIAQRARRPDKPVVKLSVITDKHEVDNSEVDCPSIHPICQARCCTLNVHLAEQDVREGKIEWEIRDPYSLPRSGDGYCIYLERETGRCGCYHDRPATCRTYSCKEDKRIWIDFDERIPADMPRHVIPLRLGKSRPESGARAEPESEPS